MEINRSTKLLIESSKFALSCQMEEGTWTMESDHQRMK